MHLSIAGVFGRPGGRNRCDIPRTRHRANEKWVDDFLFFRYLNSTTSHFDYGLSEIYAIATELGWQWKLLKTQPFAHIYRYGSVSGKHESFHEAETVDGLSYLSLEVYEQAGIFSSTLHRPMGRSSPALALFTHAPISELVYLLTLFLVGKTSEGGDLDLFLGIDYDSEVSYGQKICLSAAMNKFRICWL
ncbi:hypothetical protein B0H14DRAFT_2647224 [Mycena olivaceomarginata]|nr:hypothetical protein B0H14DRAFT_2647224 [Mycena olivaceomarginata]